jgi:branched-chain amino acid transport system permease protein
MTLDPQILAQVLLNGLLLGGLYALAASGQNLVFGVMRIINVAHGEFMMLGAFTTYVLFAKLQLNPLLSLPVSMVLVFGLGWFLQKRLVRRAMEGPELMTLLVTYGIGITIMNLGLYLFSADFRSVPVFSGSLPLLGLTLSKSRGIAFAAALLITYLCYLFLQKSAMGKAIRATAQHAEVAQVCGIDVEQVRLVTFGLGAALAAASGSLVIFIVSVAPSMGQIFILKAFAICVIGGLGSFTGALGGGLILGVAEALAALYGSSQIAEAVAYVLLILVLLVRPQGLLGLKE